MVPMACPSFLTCMPYGMTHVMQDLVKRFVAGWLQGDRKAQRRALVAREKAVKASIKHAMQNVDTVGALLAGQHCPGWLCSCRWHLETGACWDQLVRAL